MESFYFFRCRRIYYHILRPISFWALPKCGALSKSCNGKEDFVIHPAHEPNPLALGDFSFSLAVDVEASDLLT